MTSALELSEKRRLLLERMLAREGHASAEVRRIPRRAGGGPAPLSFGQQRLWFLHELAPESAAYIISERVHLRGAFHPAALRSALAAAVRRHEVLRTSFPAVDGEPVQVVAEPSVPALPCVDLAALPEAVRRDEARRVVSRLAVLPFSLRTGPLLRTVLLRLDGEDNVLLLAMHHIVADGWSMGILVRELTALYATAVAGRSLELPELPIQFADFAAWQRNELRGEALDTQLAWWLERLDGAPTQLQLPTDRPRPEVQGWEGRRIPLKVAPEVAGALRATAERQGASLYMLLAAALGVLLQRYSGQDDLLLGTVSAGRNRPELTDLIGFFVNTLVLRLDLADDPAVPLLLDRVRDMALGADARQDVPFEKLVDALGLERELSHNPVFQVLLNFQNLPPGTADGLGNLAISGFETENRTAQFDLYFELEEGPRGLVGSLGYRTDLFDKSTARRLARSFETLLTGIADYPGRRASELPLLDAAERREQITAWNRPAAEPAGASTLDRLFAAAAARRPTAPALTWEGGSLTYDELHRRASQLAHQLRRLGVGPESRVGLCVERSPEMVVGILGILGAGGAYVPLDPDVPRERLAYLLADSGVRVLLTQEALAADLPAGGADLTLLRLDADRTAIERESDAPPTPAAQPGNAAYVIYTSGSTGRPKGVVVTHANVARLLAATEPWFGFGPEDVWTLFHSYAFDFSVWEIWGALAYGGRLVLVPWEVSRSPEAFLELLADERVTVLNQTPSAFRQLVHAEAAAPRDLALRQVIFGGEALELPALASWFARHGDERPRLVNMYGITETTVHVTFRPIARADATAGRGSAIGVPIPDLRIHLLDRHLEPVPLLAPGEICVGGAGLARGYLGRPDLTAERFVPDPFGALTGTPGERLYRSGDLARRRPDGDLEYLGRRDQQVKIRGFRIETGEIEALLGSHPEVRDAVVLPWEGAEGRRLAAWVVLRRPDADGQLAELRRFVQERLPEYMVPAVFMPLAELPLTVNGKLDRRALPAPDPSAAQSESVYAAPTTPAESLLAEIWAEVLGVERVGAHDNFFALGGDSILSLRVVERVRQRGSSVTLRQLFQHQTVRELARELGDANAGETATVPFALISAEDRARLPEGLEDAYPLTRIQAGMLFHSQLAPGTAVYHDILSERLKGPFDEAALQRSLARAVARHPVLRTTFELRATSEPLQLVHREVAARVEVDDLRGLPEPERERVLAAWLDAERHRDFDWSRPPLLRFHAHRLADDVFQHTLSFHHSMLDGWSAASLRTELFRDYVALTEGRELPEEPPPPAAFREFVRLEQEALASAATRDFWQRLLAGATPNRLPRWPYERPEAPRAHDYFVPVSPETTAELRKAARLADVPLKSLLFAVHLAVIARICGETDVVTGLVVHGRPEQEGGTATLGLFLNTVPFRLRLGGESWAGLARAAFELEREILAHQRLPLGEIQNLAGGQELFETAFGITQFHVYQGVKDVRGVQSLSTYGYEETNFPLGANFEIAIDGSRITLRLNSSEADAAPEQIRAIGDCYGRALASLAAAPEQPHGDASLLSDEERHQLLDVWSQGGPAFPRANAARLFEEKARETPDALAVVGDETRLTYGELDRRANQVARALRMWGVGPETHVAVCLDRAPGLLVGLLAIWKAGGAWVPLDPAYPLERLLYVLEDSQAAVLVTEEKLLADLPSQVDQIPMLRLDSDGWLIDTQEDTPLPDASDVESPAYLIYTSGSTGTPKGVVVPHGGLGNLAAAQIALFDIRPGDRVLQMASLSFDAAVSEILMALLGGAELHLAVPSRLLPGPGLVDLLVERRITHVTLPPSVLAVLPEAALPDLRVLVVAGEACPPELVQRWGGGPAGRRVVDAYGPTEATVCATGGAVVADGGRPLIGRPIAGARVLVLDPWGQPAPTAAPGEIHLGGSGLARGYWRRPDLTAERFVSDPFATTPGARLYRTGDLGRWLPGGVLDFLGRADQQLKIRGFRIEPGEVEGALRRHPKVRDAVVGAYQVGTDRRLAAWVVPHDRDGDEASGALPGELQAFLRSRLPEHMVPSAIVALDALPLTVNGKLDRRALPDPESARHGEGVYEPPRTETESQLAALWQEVLGAERVGRGDRFLQLGGHSLVAMQLILRIRAAFGIEIPLNVLYSSTLEEMAIAVASAQAAKLDADLLAELLDEVEQIPRGGDE